MQFTAAAAPKGKRVYLEIADVHDYAKVTLNGKEVGAQAWQPYRWDVTGALKKGANDLVIEAYALSAQGGRGGAGGAPPAAVLLRLRLLRLLRRWLRVRRALLGQALRRRPAWRLGLGLRGAAGAPAGTPPAGYGAAGEEQDAERPQRRRLRACLVPSSWWRTNRQRAADDSTSLHWSGERNRVPPGQSKS